MKWQDAVRLRMAQKGLVEDDIAPKVGVKRAGFNHWMNGRRSPTPEQLEVIATVLHCTVGDLFEGEKFLSLDPDLYEDRILQQIARSARVRVMQSVLVEKNEGWLLQDFSPLEPAGSADVPTDDEAAFALVILGDGLFPVIRDGSLLVVEPSVLPKPGGFALIETIDSEFFVRELLFATEKEASFGSINGAPGRMTLPKKMIKRMCACWPLPGDKFVPDVKP
ncbi:S24 family peptidase [Nevskia ramosa]|uniref:S24 family peptidase n=1 Tax=Nevskia ramosa TaxID=64002 RepID=UPI003D0AA297